MSAALHAHLMRGVVANLQGASESLDPAHPAQPQLTFFASRLKLAFTNCGAMALAGAGAFLVLSPVPWLSLLAAAGSAALFKSAYDIKEHVRETPLIELSAVGLNYLGYEVRWDDVREAHLTISEPTRLYLTTKHGTVNVCPDWLPFCAFDRVQAFVRNHIPADRWAS